jgi:hypothetical protein
MARLYRKMRPRVSGAAPLTPELIELAQLGVCLLSAGHVPGITDEHGEVDLVALEAAWRRHGAEIVANFTRQFEPADEAPVPFAAVVFDGAELTPPASRTSRWARQAAELIERYVNVYAQLDDEPAEERGDG